MDFGLEPQAAAGPSVTCVIDGMADPFDNCPRVVNPDQVDADHDGVGDTCQAIPLTPTSTPLPATPTVTPIDRDDDGCTMVANGDGDMLVLLPAVMLLYLRRWARATSPLASTSFFTRSRSHSPCVAARNRGGGTFSVAPSCGDGYSELVSRRHAILDDNQRILERRIADLRARLPGLLAGRVCAAMVIGSVAEGRAHDGSDLDLVLVLKAGSPRRSDYEWWDRDIAPQLTQPGRFPVQPVIVGRSALQTTEPHLRQALRCGLPLWDPERILS